ncbi:MAG: hypothetical protein JWM91_2158 [Rhodospirillales bacterium]|nr:hypothetical protein [Rhodospirillales bacterium]
MPIITRLYHRPEDATATVRELKDAGIDEDDISLVSGRADATLAHVTLAGASQVDDCTEETEDPDVTQTAVSAGTGEAIGALIGGGAGLLAGLGVLAIPGIGSVIAAGWLVATVTGAGAGAVAGSLLGTLLGAGLSEEHAERHIEGIKRGGTLVTVRSDPEQALIAERIMDSRAKA